MRRLKTIISIAGILLLILSAASMYVALKALSELCPAEDYEDQGVPTFRPYDVLPVQVQNTGASSHDRRMNPTKTVYMVYYRDIAALVLAGAYVMLYAAAWFILILVKKAKRGSQVW